MEQGVYGVKMFFEGKWRTIILDDQIASIKVRRFLLFCCMSPATASKRPVADWPLVGAGLCEEQGRGRRGRRLRDVGHDRREGCGPLFAEASRLMRSAQCTVGVGLHGYRCGLPSGFRL